MLKQYRALAAELLFWFAIPTLFICHYVASEALPAGAIAEHLYFVFLLAAAAILIKLVLFRTLRHQKVALVLASAVYAALMYLLVCYYAAVHVILGVWGKVITEELIVTYAMQARDLSEQVGIPFILAALMLTGAFLAVWAICYVGLKKWGAWPVLPKKYPVAVAVGLPSALLVAIYYLVCFLATPSTVGEPVALTLYSGKLGGLRKTFSQGSTVAADVVARDRAVREQYQPAEKTSGTNAILIVLDGVRYDHMGIYGYPRDTTPYLSSLAAAGKLSVATQVRSSCGETTCGLGSLSSGRYSHEIPPEPFTLTKVVKRHGYQVRMIMGDNQSNSYQPKLLYGPVDDFFDGPMAKGWYALDDGLILEHTRALPTAAGPVMLQYHLMAAHTLGKRNPAYARFQPYKVYAGRTSGAPDQRYTNYHDNGILQADDEIRQLLASLGAKGYLQDALVVITADHGESLGEHDLFSHTNSVREELLHIPLVFIRFNDGKAQAGQPYERFTAQIDIAPTILHALGMPIPSNWTGKPMQVEQKVPDFTFFQMVPYLGLYDHRDPRHLWKFWVNMRTHEQFAFDLTTDPRENSNLIRTVPAALSISWQAQLRTISMGRR